MTQAQLDALRAEYESWNPHDPESPSADEIAARHGVAKNTMYTWRSRGWRLEGRDGEGAAGWGAKDADPDHGLVRYLTEELVKARIEIQQLRDRLDQLQHQ